MNVCARWRNIVKFHEIDFENGGDRCIMDESIRMRVSSPFICHVLCPVVPCFWMLEIRLWTMKAVVHMLASCSGILSNP